MPAKSIVSYQFKLVVIVELGHFYGRTSERVCLSSIKHMKQNHEHKPEVVKKINNLPIIIESTNWCYLGVF